MYLPKQALSLPMTGSMCLRMVFLIWMSHPGSGWDSMQAPVSIRDRPTGGLLPVLGHTVDADHIRPGALNPGPQPAQVEDGRSAGPPIDQGVTSFSKTPTSDLFPAREVISWYRRKNKVEEAFHEIKSHLDLRPVFLTRSERVRAHVTVCILAYFLYNDMELRLRQHLPEMSCEDALEILKECLINRISFEGTGKTKLGITRVSPAQKEILDALDAGGVSEPKLVKRLLKKAENWL